MTRKVMRISISIAKQRFSRYLRMAENQQIIITRRGKPAGLLIGFATEDDWFDYRLENDPRFLARIAEARESIRQGKGIPIEDLR